MLPSVSDWMSQTFDPQHSVLATLRSIYHVIALKFHKEEFQNNLWRFDFNLPLSFDSKRLDYNRPTLVDTTFTKLFLLFRPSATAHHVWIRQSVDGRTSRTHELNLQYDMGMEPPSMSYYVNVRNDDNPLQVYTGNDRLRVTSRHHWKADYKWNNMDKQRIFSAQIGYQIIQNAIAMGYTYDRKNRHLHLPSRKCKR